MNIDNLKAQHNKIDEILKDTIKLVNKKNFKEEGKLIAKNISQLAGVLKVHLGNEDRNLYPKLKNSGDISVKNLANNYISEMGNLNNVFTKFKNSFNTDAKINKNISEFTKEFKIVFAALEKRMKKEDTELYPIAEKI